jgi:hypothetical protein
VNKNWSAGFTLGALLVLLMLTIAGCNGAPPQPTASTIPTTSFIPTATASLTPESISTITLTLTATPLPVVRFAVIGDYGQAGENLAAVAALVDSWEVDFILTTGDNNYPSGAADTIDKNIGQYFHHYIHPYRGDYGDGARINRFFPSLGNHDWYTASAQPYLDYFDLPGNERYYTFTWEFIDFFALDSDWVEPDGIGRDSAQAQWLQGALSASQAAWKVVYFHHAPYSSGYHGSTVHMRWPFVEWGADVVLAGHDHHYERLQVDGLLYFVNGLGGGARYSFGETEAGSQLRYNARHGAMLVEVTPQQMIFSFVNVDREVVDRFVFYREE